MIVNDKTIFSYLLPLDNEMLSKINKDDMFELIFYINKYYLEYRDTLFLDNNNTFGIEIEFEHFWDHNNCNFVKFQSNLNLVVGNNKWDVVNDWSLKKGGEVVSPVLTDEIDSWKKIKMVCDFVSLYGSIDVNCASHVHAGSQILGENSTYWYRFFKLWSIYENVIYRFCYGENLGYRPNILRYARPAALFYNERLKLVSNKEDYSVNKMLSIIEPKVFKDERYTKNFGVSYWRMLADDKYDKYEDYNKLNYGCTLEFRVPNGTLNEIIWQNNINLFIKMMLYCKSDRYNDDILDRRKILVEDNFSNIVTYSNIYLEQVMEFVDMIFDNNLDKIYFLKQYLKNMEEFDNSFVKVKKLTVSDRR